MHVHLGFYIQMYMLIVKSSHVLFLSLDSFRAIDLKAMCSVQMVTCCS